MRLCLALIMCGLVMAAAPVLAQGSLGIGPQLGIYKAQDADDTRLMGGVAARLKFSQDLGIEGSVNFRQEDYNDGNVTVTSWPVMVTGLIYVIPVVYGAIGAGWYNTSVDYEFPPGYLGGPGLKTSEASQEVGWHLGGGAEIPAGTAGKLVGDIRYVFLNYEFEQIPGTEVDSNFFVVTAAFFFGLQ